MIYIARTTKPTKNLPVVGTIVDAAAELPGREKELAKDIVSWMRDGLAVERVPNDFMKEYLGLPEECTPKPEGME